MSEYRLVMKGVVKTFPASKRWITLSWSSAPAKLWP